MKQFLSVKEASIELGLSCEHIRKLIKEIKAHIPERYSRTDVFEGKNVAIRFVALQDWAETRKKLEVGAKPEPYDPIKRERELGIIDSQERTIRLKSEDADYLAKKFVVEMARMMGVAAMQ